MVFVQHDRSCLRGQALAGATGERVARARICLLKACEKWFHPFRRLARYCSQACRDAARDWSVWQAGQRYRATERGKERRRQQAKRYRQRVRERQQAVAEQTTAGEGHQDAADSEKIPCSRPGCYELFPPERRSPLKKFCCALCREALRRVRQREARWGWRTSSLTEDRWERFRGPPDGFG